MLTRKMVAVTCCVAAMMACDTQGQGEARTGQPLHRAAVVTDEDAGAPENTCGNGRVAWHEECDPEAPGWADACNPDCRRSVYQPCERSVDCPVQNALCASYTNLPGSQFCAEPCETDASCPVLPGFEAVCNFAWCAIRCNDGDCPNGMTCVRDQTLLDHAGKGRGTGDICVVLSDR